MKKRIKLITLLLLLTLSLSLLTACDFNGFIGSLTGDKNVTIMSKTEQTNFSLLYAPGDEDAKEAANSFKSQLADYGFSSVGHIYSSDSISEKNEILFGNTDRAVSAEAYAFLEENSKASPEDYHYVFYYSDGKLAIAAKSAIAYNCALREFFESYIKGDAITISSSLKEHGITTKKDYEDYLAEQDKIQAEKDKIAAEEKKAENAVLLKDLLPLLETQRTELNTIKGSWNMYKEISATNPEIYLFKDYTQNIGASRWGTVPVDPIDEHPRLLVTSDKLPLVRKELKEDNRTNNYFLSLIDTTLPNEGLLPESTYSGNECQNHNEAYLSTIQVKALAYLIYEDEYYGYQAIYYMKNYLKSLDIKDDPSDQARSFGYIMYTTALVYDWCYDLLTETDKTQFIAGVENIICRGENLAGEKLETSFPPSQQSSFTGHGAEYQVLRDYLSFAVAIYGDNDSWWDYIGARVCNAYAPSTSYYFQSGIAHQGTGYAALRVNANLYSAWIVKTATGVNPYEGLENVIRAMLGYECKPGQLFTDGDNSNCLDYKPAVLFLDCAYISAYLYGDEAMLAQSDYMEKVNSKTFGDGFRGLSAAAYIALRGFCELEPGEDRYEGMPLIQYNGYPLGQYIIHEAWNDADAASAVLRIKEVSTANHEHEDSGTFEIYYKGMLTSDGGVYSSAGQDHLWFFHHATIAHNGLIIYNSALAGTNGGWYSGGQDRLLNTAAGNSLAEWLGNEDLYTGIVTGRQHAYKDGDETQPLYAYIAGDITDAYSAETVSYVGRRMLSVFTGDDTYPMLLFVYDDITSLNEASEKRFLLQISSPNEPTINDKTIVTENGEGRLVLTCLSDNVTFNKVGGRVYKSGKYDCAKSMNYFVNGKQVVHASGSDDGHWGRVEIVYSKKANNVTFMNLLYVTDKGNTKMATVRKTSFDNGLTGGSFDRKIVGLFATSRDRANTEISCKTTGSTSMIYYVSGVAAGEWTVTVDKTVIGTYTATEEGGLLTFTAPAGEIVLTPKN